MIRERFQALIAVKAAKKNVANAFFKNQINGRSGGDTFTQGLNASGTGAPTWYWTITILEKWQLAKVLEVANANTTDIKIVIWPHQKGTRQQLLEKLDAMANITIANARKSPSVFLQDIGMKVVKANGN